MGKKEDDAPLSPLPWFVLEEPDERLSWEARSLDALIRLGGRPDPGNVVGWRVETALADIIRVPTNSFGAWEDFSRELERSGLIVFSASQAYNQLRGDLAHARWFQPSFGTWEEFCERALRWYRRWDAATADARKARRR